MRITRLAYLALLVSALMLSGISTVVQPARAATSFSYSAYCFSKEHALIVRIFGIPKEEPFDIIVTPTDAAPLTYPAAYHDWDAGGNGEFPFRYADGTYEITINLTNTGESVSLTQTCLWPTAEGSPIPAGFELRTIICDVAVFNAPGGQPVGDNAIQSGQTWYVNPIATDGPDGEAWTEIFVSGPINGYIPARCVG